MNIINLRAEYLRWFRETDFMQELGIPNEVDEGCEDAIDGFVNQRFQSANARRDAKTFLLADMNDKWDEVEIIETKPVLEHRDILCCYVRVEFKGIYEWGEGWSRETAEKWHDVLLHIPGFHWRYLEERGDYLVSTCGGFYLHPENFEVVLRSSGGTMPRGNNDELEDHFGSQLDNLKEICDALCKACGGSYTMKVSSFHENCEMKEW